MLLQRIKLRGFLGHFGVRSETAGKADWVEIDFSSSPLWLVHGPNGGGKSSLWDALTFALFKEHRAGSKSNFDKLVHDKTDKAEIEVELSLRGGHFRISAEIEVKGNKRSAKTSRIVEVLNGSDWETVAGNEQKVEEWVQRNLSVSFNTFTSAVLLRQGEADRFLTAKAAECRTILTELLQLSFYRELDVAATKRRNREKEKLDECERHLRDLSNPTDEELAEQRQIISANEQSLALLNEQIKQKHVELENAQLFEKRSAEIAEKQKQQQANAAIIAEATSIEVAARRYRELKDGLIQLDKLWEAKDELGREARTLQEAQTGLAATEEKLREASAKLESHRQDEGQASGKLAQAQTSLESAQQSKGQIVDQVRTLGKLESLEADIAREQDKLRPHLSILAERERIERNWRRYDVLRQAIPLLENLTRTRSQLDQAQTDLAEAETKVEDHSGRSRQAEADEKSFQEKLEQIANAINEINGTLNGCKNKLGVLRDKLESRDSITGKEECPTCGEVLSAEKLRRVEEQRAHFRQEIAKLENEERSLSSQLTEKTSASREAQKQFELKKILVLQLSKAEAAARNDLEHARKAVDQARQAHSEAAVKAKDWANQLSQLERLKSEWQQLSNAPQEIGQLNEADSARNKVEAVMAAYQNKLYQLPAYTSEERLQIRAEAKNAEQTVVDCEQNLKAAHDELQRATQLRGDTEIEQSALQAKCQAEQRQLSTLRQRLSDAQQKYDQAMAGLAPAWATHPSCEDDAALAALRDERASLQSAEDLEESLKEARRSADQLAGAIETLEKQLSEILPEHRRPASEVTTEKLQVEQQQRLADEQLRAARERLTEMKREQNEFERQRKARDAAAGEFTLYKKLAEKLGKQGLLSQIIQQAQEQIAINANGILGRLSNGLWQVDLRNGRENELHIEARDLMTGQTRPFKCLSGGEKFRVSVSLAVAIGQYVLGGRSVDTLIIDEGFGALDETNRDLLVKELSNLSEEVLSGGRVIVVSHQEDVCDRFGSRYRIEKEADGYIKVRSGRTE